jgi:dihydrofolate reductase
MKIILYMAITPNGMIATKEDNTGWISKVESDSYSSIVRKAGNLVVGRRTYNILSKQPEFSELLKAVKVVVVAQKKAPSLIGPNHSVVSSPKEALQLLKDFEEVVVAGGGILDSSFLADNLIDEIYLDVEPIILGRGIGLFSEGNFETRLELMGIKNISKNEVQLHYKVVRSGY